jgi:hypothetical protein
MRMTRIDTSHKFVNQRPVLVGNIAILVAKLTHQCRAAPLGRRQFLTTGGAQSIKMPENGVLIWFRLSTALF